MKIGIIVSHTAHLLKYIQADRAHVILEGGIGCSGSSPFILENINRYEFRECIRCISN